MHHASAGHIRKQSFQRAGTGWVPYTVGVPLIPALMTAFVTDVRWPFPLSVFHSVSLVLWRWAHEEHQKSANIHDFSDSFK